MIIVRLTYYSRNCVAADHRLRGDGAPAHDRINDILIESVANNRRDDITGALIHDDHWFAQALEGPETKVSATFERILRDERHGDVRLIKMQPVAERRFAAWWMACVARSDDNADLFRQHCECACFDPQLMRPDRLGDLIEAVAARAPRAGGRAAWTDGGVTDAA
jgi:Sensors of blue-light using FAD